MTSLSGIIRIKRPLACCAAGYAAGIALGAVCFAPLRPSLMLLVLMGIVGMLSAGVALGLRGVMPKRVMAVAAALILGCTAGTARATVPMPIEGKVQGVLTGVVSEITDAQSDWPCLLLRDAVLEGERLPFKLNIYVQAPLTDIAPGDRVMMSAKFGTPQEQRNPGGYDARASLWRRGIGMSGYGLAPEKIGTAPLNAFEVSRGIRARLDDALRQWLPGWEGDVMSALLLGVREEVPDTMAANFQRIGVTHILSLSGLHVGFFVIALQHLLFFLGKRRVAAVSIIVVWAYAWVVGLMPTVVRAAVMVSVAQGAVLAGRKSDAATSLMLAAFIILLFDPLQLFAASFQLSFCAMGGLFLIEPVFTRKLAAWQEKTPLRHSRLTCSIASLVSMSAAAQIGTLPLSVYLFNQVPILALLANLPIVPISSVLLFCGMALLIAALIGLTPVAAALAWIGVGLVRAMDLLAEWLAAIPGTLLRIASPSLLTLALAMALIAALAWLMRNHRHRLRVITCAALTMLVLASGIADAANNRPDGLEIAFVDVGQGDGAVLRYGTQTAVIDTGTPGNAMARYLRHIGAAVDVLFITHPHDDHAGGLEAILKDVPVKRIVLSAAASEQQGEEAYKRGMALARARGIPIDTARAGDAFVLGKDVSLEVLWPSPDLQTGDQNRASLVIAAHFNQSAALFTGDLDDYAERQLTGLPRADVLKVAHHGSKYGTTQGFLDETQPRLAVISSGENSFGHPTPETINRLHAAGAVIARTDEGGMTRVNLLPSGGVRYRIYLPKERRNQGYEVIP